jgi:hypothetical protein
MGHLRGSALTSLNCPTKCKSIDFVLDMFGYTNVTLRRRTLTTGAKFLSETS